MAPAIARKLLSRILAEGSGVRFSTHALLRMAERNMLRTDVHNVLRGGWITEPAELEHGTWRYRVHTQRMGVVVAFRSESHVAVVTAWRKP